ncbi:MAG: alpha-1,2-fucosyltransferase, partial [Bacteroidota bacterium]|nr:alpha-1,2-fucosyltransferase [Bacteroidota bacterium]
LPIAKQLREKDFIPVTPVSGLNAELLGQILNCNSASIHVRRGDYVHSESSNKYHGTCSIDYYERSAKILADQADVNHFFVFSDDPDWVRANIVLPYPATFVSHNQGRESYWDLYLMRHCKHHIIANSSFSWWGAWLNPSTEKIVIAPQNWFNDPSASNNEIIPEGWIKN